MDKIKIAKIINCINAEYTRRRTFQGVNEQKKIPRHSTNLREDEILKNLFHKCQQN